MSNFYVKIGDNDMYSFYGCRDSLRRSYWKNANFFVISSKYFPEKVNDEMKKIFSFLFSSYDFDIYTHEYIFVKKKTDTSRIFSLKAKWVTNYLRYQPFQKLIFSFKDKYNEFSWESLVNFWYEEEGRINNSAALYNLEWYIYERLLKNEKDIFYELFASNIYGFYPTQYFRSGSLKIIPPVILDFLTPEQKIWVKNYYQKYMVKKEEW